MGRNPKADISKFTSNSVFRHDGTHITQSYIAYTQPSSPPLLLYIVNHVATNHHSPQFTASCHSSPSPPHHPAKPPTHQPSYLPLSPTLPSKSQQTMTTTVKPNPPPYPHRQTSNPSSRSSPTPAPQQPTTQTSTTSSPTTHPTRIPSRPRLCKYSVPPRRALHPP